MPRADQCCMYCGIAVISTTPSHQQCGIFLQALEEERLGPRREPYSDERQKRLAVQEAAIALICTLMPAIEPVTLVRSDSLGFIIAL